jgi:hypothetical protein
MLMWGAPKGPNLERRGVVLVTPDVNGEFSFNYEGGTEIQLDVLGYFTNSTADSGTAGLYVPAAIEEVITENFVAGVNVVGEVPSYAGAAFVNVSAEAGVTGSQDPRDLSIASGRTIGTALGVSSASGSAFGLEVLSSAELRAELQLLGVFLK